MPSLDFLVYVLSLSRNSQKESVSTPGLFEDLLTCSLVAHMIDLVEVPNTEYLRFPNIGSPYPQAYSQCWWDREGYSKCWWDREDYSQY